MYLENALKVTVTVTAFYNMNNIIVGHYEWPHERLHRSLNQK